MEVVLTGIKPTGKPGTLHIGNYVGAMKPAVAASKNPNVHSYYFLADYHAIGGDADSVRALDARDRGELARRRPRSEQSRCSIGSPTFPRSPSSRGSCTA